MPNGVICGGAVDGSNQLGAMVMGQAITASPAGGGWPVTSRAAPSVSTTGTRSGTRRLASRFFNVVSIPLLLGQRRTGSSHVRSAHNARSYEGNRASDEADCCPELPGWSITGYSIT